MSSESVPPAPPIPESKNRRRLRREFKQYLDERVAELKVAESSARDDGDESSRKRFCYQLQELQTIRRRFLLLAQQ